MMMKILKMMMNQRRSVEQVGDERSSLFLNDLFYNADWEFYERVVDSFDA